MPDSQTIRRQIGKLSKQLSRNLAAANDTLADYEIAIDNVQLQNVHSDDLPMLRKDCTNARSNLLASYTRLEQLHEKWYHSSPPTAKKKKYSLNSSLTTATTVLLYRMQYQLLNEWILFFRQLTKNSRNANFLYKILVETLLQHPKISPSILRTYNLHHLRLSN
ncbi:hypothetical protein GCK32_009169 [Trichostrongylus colubriformis]|uniref:Uncharacterized protein n=1 Tax=Trichostrongylus colubriformis TaxID=6319 RepID=A0AAN8FJW5_TRICO